MVSRAARNDIVLYREGFHRPDGGENLVVQEAFTEGQGLSEDTLKRCAVHLLGGQAQAFDMRCAREAPGALPSLSANVKGEAAKTKRSELLVQGAEEGILKCAPVILFVTFTCSRNSELQISMLIHDASA